MNNFNRLGISLAVVSALSLGLTGCGSSDSTDSATSTTTTISDSANSAENTVTVERGKVYGATVTDSTTPTNQTATQNDGENTYTFENEIVYPVKVEGGFIDVDGDGQYSEGDLDLDMELVSYEDNVTTISTYISKDANGDLIPSEEERQAKLDSLVAALDDPTATAQELLKLPSDQAEKAQMATNALYAQMAEPNSTDVDLSEVTEVVSKLQEMVDTNSSLQGLSSSDMAMELEKAIIADPDMDPTTDNAMTTVTESDVEELQSRIITVERGKVYGATVTDSTTPTNQTAKQNSGTNTYTFDDEIVYPVKVEGGFIDVDGDGQYSEGDLALNMELVSYEDNVTAISTYISKDENGDMISSEVEREARLNELVSALDDANATAQELLKLPSDQTPEAQMATNSVYAEMVDENSTDIQLSQVTDRVEKFHELVDGNSDFENLSSSEMALKLEEHLIADPDMDPTTNDAMTTVTESDISSSTSSLDTDSLHTDSDSTDENDDVETEISNISSSSTEIEDNNNTES